MSDSHLLKRQFLSCSTPAGAGARCAELPLALVSVEPLCVEDTGEALRVAEEFLLQTIEKIYPTVPAACNWKGKKNI